LIGKESIEAMFDFLPDPVRGAFSLLVVTLNTIFWSSLLYVVALLKAVIPIDTWRLFCLKLMNDITQNWVWVNSFGLQHTKNIQWDVEGADALNPDEWYLVVANHQSMVDIVVLQKILHGKTPVLKFFLKKELFWVPVLGIVWWALDFPFMKRSSSVQKDFETARKASEKFKLAPVSIMNFVEGTRFTLDKRDKQHSPFKHLLKPKAGGIAVVLGALGKRLDSILDVTIVYPEGALTIWPFLCSRSMKVTVRIRQLPITQELLGDYLADRDFRRRFNTWLNALWADKDKTIERLLQASDSTPGIPGTPDSSN
jgi:1-acyl-sn-glycerol-3-phosphate acyltransferase